MRTQVVPQTRPTTFSDRNLLLISLVLFAIPMTCSIFGAPSWIENLLRAAFLIGSGRIFFISLVVVRVYYRNYKVAPEHARLLPRHVTQLGVLVMVYVFVTSAITIDKVGDYLVWYGIPFLLPTVFIGFVGLMDMVRWLPDRRKDLQPTGEEKRRATD